MGVVMALSPRPAGPTHPPKTIVLAMAPESAELAEAPESAVRAKAAAVALLEAEPHQWQHVVV